MLPLFLLYFSYPSRKTFTRYSALIHLQLVLRSCPVQREGQVRNLPPLLRKIRLRVLFYLLLLVLKRVFLLLLPLLPLFHLLPKLDFLQAKVILRVCDHFPIFIRAISDIIFFRLN